MQGAACTRRQLHLANYAWAWWVLTGSWACCHSMIPKLNACRSWRHPLMYVCQQHHVAACFGKIRWGTPRASCQILVDAGMSQVTVTMVATARMVCSVLQVTTTKWCPHLGPRTLMSSNVGCRLLLPRVLKNVLLRGQLQLKMQGHHVGHAVAFVQKIPSMTSRVRFREPARARMPETTAAAIAKVTAGHLPFQA